MSTVRIDLLKVMADHAEGIEQAYKLSRGKRRDEIMVGLMELRESYDALAELIEAVRAERHAYMKPYIDAIQNGTRVVDMSSYMAARNRVDAALDRIGSAT